MSKKKTTALTVRTAAGDLAKLDTIDAQFALFDRFKLARTMAETHKFVESGDDKHPYKLVKRENPVRIFDNGSTMVAASIATNAERVGLNRMRRAKYGDENKLFDQDSASLKVGEVAAWATI